MLNQEWKSDVETQLKQFTEQKKHHTFGLAVKLLDALVRNDRKRVQEYVSTINGTETKLGNKRPINVINELLTVFANRAASRHYETIEKKAKELCLEREDLHYFANDAFERGREKESKLLSSCVNMLDLCSGRLQREIKMWSDLQSKGQVPKPRETTAKELSEPVNTVAGRSVLAEEGIKSEPKDITSGKLLSASELAKAIAQPTDRVETFLRRYRRNHLDCFTETTNRKANEPQFLYYADKVMDELKAKNWPTVE